MGIETASEISLQQVLEKTPYRNYFFLLGDTLFWTNRCMLARDDPNLQRALENCKEFVIGERIERGKTYALYPEEDGVKITGSGGEINHLEEITGWFLTDPVKLDKDKTKYRKLHCLEKMIVVPAEAEKRAEEGRAESYALLLEDGVNAVLADRLYYDYLQSLGYANGEMYLANESPTPIVYFLGDNRVKAILAPLSDFAEIRDGKVKEIKKEGVKRIFK